MKRVLPLVILGWLLAAGCASNPNNGHPAVPASSEELPREASVGMTREEIARIYGEPKSVIMTQNGETWHYDNTAKLWIPFNFGWRYRQSNFYFDRTGHLKTFRIDQ